MPDLHIAREHTLGLAEARRLAQAWADSAQEKLAMSCEYQTGPAEDCVTFSRSGASGELRVSADRFELDVKLGFLLGAFKDRIEHEITKNIDKLLQQPDPVASFQKVAGGWPKA